VVGGADVNHWWDNGANAIAFSRGDKGFVVINHEGQPLTATLSTGLPTGTYCDVLTGGLGSSGCAGSALSVTAGGTVQINLPANSAIAVDVASKS
jgi:alpha-amylase